MTDEKSSPGANGELVTVKANKLVVVSAGTFGSPMILERSGIGARSVLEKNNIRIQVDLPGVGENYLGRCSMSMSISLKTSVVSDHLGAFPVFYASNETETMDNVWGNPEAISGEQLTRDLEYQHNCQLNGKNGRRMGLGKLLIGSSECITCWVGLLVAE